MPIKKLRDGAENAGESAWNGAKSTGSFARKQVGGTWRRTRSFVGWLTLDRLLPSGVSDTIQEGIVKSVQALGIRGTSRKRQFASAVTLAVMAYGFTLLSGGLLIGFAVVWSLLVLVALARNIPFVNKQWKEGTSMLPIKSDYDIPGWERD